ncbi:MAG: fatty acid desaturase CarF family protein [Myxococcota bacterium]
MESISRRQSLGAWALERLYPDTCESRPIHRLVAVANSVLCAVLFAQIVGQIAQLPNPGVRTLAALGALLAAALGASLADFLSGMIHFYLDNYPRPETPVVGRMAAEFQKHHDRMSDLLLQEAANVTYPTGQASFFGLLALALWDPPFLFTSLALVAVAGLYLSQLFHQWAHHPPGESSAPRFARWLQRHGVLISFDRHVPPHHLSPWDKSYTIVSGRWNDFLDATCFWRRLERILFERLGWEPNSWKLSDEVRSLALSTKPTPRS